MTDRPWGRRATRPDPGAGDLRVQLAARIDLRFSVTADGFAARLTEISDAAGVPAADSMARLSLDDLYLATACAEGDPQAWAECEATHFAFIRTFAHRFLPDAQARDVADQVIADLWQRRKIARYSGRSTLRTWLGAVVAHAAVNARRATRPLVPLTQNALVSDTAGGGASDAASLEDAQSERLLARLVARAIVALPADEKFLLLLYYEQELTLEQMEIATRLSKATLSRRLKGIRSRLKTAVDDLATEATGTSGLRVHEGLRLDQLELDLSTLLRSDGHVGRTEA